MKKYLLSAFLVTSLGLVQSCKNEFDTDYSTVTPKAGTADFSKYVALGNSLTSGFRDNALYRDGQNESYPNLIAMQMKLAGGGDFKQPLMPDNIGGFTGLPVRVDGKLVLQTVNGSLAPVASAAQSSFASIASQGPYNNLGIPGAKSYQLGSPALAQNPYYARVATNPGTSTVIGDAAAQKPTFFSLWIGNNDVLAYATSGGVGVDQTGNTNPATYGQNDITDPQVLAGAISGYVSALKNAGAKGGVLANIPNISAIPYFTTVSYNAIPLDQATATTLNTNLLNSLRAALTALGQPNRIQQAVAGQNPVLLKDDKLANLSVQLTAVLTKAGLPAQQAAALGQIFGQARHATAADRVLLPTSAVLGTAPANAPAGLDKYGVSYPLEDQHVLSAGEAEEVRVATVAYNNSIAQIAAANSLALADINSAFNTLAQTSGMLYNGVRYTTSFVSGGTFSLDGVHPTGRGAAILANEFIRAINAKYGSTLPQVNPNNYSGVTFP